MKMSAGITVMTLAVSAGCSRVDPGAGYEAVLVRQPWIVGHGGVDSTSIKTGLTYVAPSTTAIYVDMRPITEDFEEADIMTRDGVPLEFKASVRYQVIDAVDLVTHFGADSGWFDRNLAQPFGQAVRSAVKQRGMNEMAISSSAAELVDAEVAAALAKSVTDFKVPIRLLNVTLGRANPPDAVKHQRIDTATQEQRIQTEQQTALAEDQRKKAETARAEADNAYRLAMSLSPEQFIQLQQIQMLKTVCGDGKCSVVLGGVSPLVTVK